ncbi:MAG: B12-binding domain-containing radical SAM protein [Myxococcota bacterium]|jgi:radical SAM superfamily enzyme YgiQ (UPF0313 family)|nr:B12-binding domain-containing radical SAM protein [Myxococcota bacterium]
MCISPLTQTIHAIILVDFCWTRDKDPRLSLGHASLLTALREHAGLEVRSMQVPVNQECLDADSVTSAILRNADDIGPDNVALAFGAYVWGEELLRQVLRRLRAAGFRGRIILGGPQISYCGRGLERLYPEADVFIRGYAEDALATLVTSTPRTPITGVHWAGTPDSLAQAAVDLERLPSPWLRGTIPLQGQSFIRWETQRGCPFHCAFCQHREPGARLHRRALSRSRIEAEIDLFCASGVREIAVLDPIFNLAPHAIGVLERFAKRGFPGRLSLQCRAEAVTAAFLDAASALDVCLEFGLQTIHEDEARAIRRLNQLERVDATLAGARHRGIAHEVSLIFGLPLQTLASFEASVDWCLQRKVPVIKAFPLLLLRGTALERERARWNLGDGGEAMPVVLQSSTFGVDDWREMAQLSEALRLTEGSPPRELHELKRLAAAQRPEFLSIGRLAWSPNFLGWLPPRMKEVA